MKKKQISVGQIIGNWKILSFIRVNAKGNNVWLCECQCENKTQREISEINLLKLSPKSCGCLIKQAGKQNKKYNQYNLEGEYGIGYTSNGTEFYFDLEDYELIKDYCWCLSKTTHTIVARIPNQNKNIALHQLIMGTYKKGHNVQVDHIHHNRHDNRKSQLRICSNSQNQMNKDKPTTNTSGHIGVSYSKKDNLWHSYIEKNGKRINAWFHSYEEAVQWREEQAILIFGEFNFHNKNKEEFYE